MGRLLLPEVAQVTAYRAGGLTHGTAGSFVGRSPGTASSAPM